MVLGLWRRDNRMDVAGRNPHAPLATPSLSRAVSPTKATKAKALERQLSAVAA